MKLFKVYVPKPLAVNSNKYREYMILGLIESPLPKVKNTLRVSVKESAYQQAKRLFLGATTRS